MKHLAGTKLLGALLAAMAIGMGVQTYYIVQVHRRLDATAAQAPAAPVQSGDVDAAPRTAAPLTPLAEFEEAEARVRDLFQGFFERFDRSPEAALLGGRALLTDGDSFLLGGGGLLGPRVDLRDRGDHYELSMDVPGAAEADVVVRAENGMLIVEGSRETAKEESEPGRFVRRERQFGHFERRLPLPQDADVGTLETSLENGVLKATLEKKS